jgi:hypothetical protein
MQSQMQGNALSGDFDQTDGKRCISLYRQGGVTCPVSCAKEGFWQLKPYIPFFYPFNVLM